MLPLHHVGVWFVNSQFWFLSIVLGGWHLHVLCKVVLTALLE